MDGTRHLLLLFMPTDLKLSIYPFMHTDAYIQANGWENPSLSMGNSELQFFPDDETKFSRRKRLDANRRDVSICRSVR